MCTFDGCIHASRLELDFEKSLLGIQKSYSSEIQGLLQNKAHSLDAYMKRYLNIQ